MEVQRNFFIFAFLFISFLLWQTWQSQSFLYKQMNKKNNLVSHMTNIKKNNNYIFIRNDVIALKINMHGGDIEEAVLLKYKDKLHSSKFFKLLETTDDFIYQAQSGLIGRDGPDSAMHQSRPVYSSTEKNFELKTNMKELRVPISWIDRNHVTYVKNFILKPGKYIVDIEYNIYNSSIKTLQFNVFGQIKQTISLPEKRNVYSKNFALQTFRGAAYSSMNERYEKYKFENIVRNKNLNILTRDGWIAMLQQYFAVAWIPKNTGLNTIYTSNLHNGIVAIGYTSSPIDVLPNSYSCIKSKLWVGPEIQKEMILVAPHLDLTVDYGWLWFLSQPLFKLLSILHDVVGNWGISIILITFIMKLITYPLTKTQYVSMTKIRKLQPKIDEIKKVFKHDKQRMSEEIIKLYRQKKINPLSGFFSILIQMPIFLSLYYMLISSVELRHAPFLLWIDDLSNQDPYYVLPVIMGITMFLIQKTSSSTISDTMHKKVMNFIPIIFTMFFLWFPAGLVLYYIVSNLVTVLQQKLFLLRFKK